MISRRVGIIACPLDYYRAGTMIPRRVYTPLGIMVFLVD